MRPKDLKIPFGWNERRPYLQDNLLYVPEFYPHGKEKFSVPALASSPLYIEYCSGNGLWIAERAKKEPNVLWVAVEKRFDRVRKIWSKSVNENISNLFIVCGFAEDFTQFYLEDSSVDKVFINFPDPWPKERHKKHRIVRDEFLCMLTPKVKKEGDLTLVTDDISYSEEMKSVLKEQKAWQSQLQYPFHKEDVTDYGSSYFEDLWRFKGKTIRHHMYKRL